MRDLSDNKYLTAVDKRALGMSIFDGVLPPKKVGGNEMLSILRDFLARLKFNIHVVGYKYLSRLLQLYLVKHDYIESDAIQMLADCYGVSADIIIDNIGSTIESNAEYVTLCAELLGVDETNISTALSDTIDVLGAVFHIYFSQIECDDCAQNQAHINFLRVLEYAQRTNK